MEAIRKNNESLKSKKSLFQAHVKTVREKYLEFETKIKALEEKTTGSISKDFEVNIIELYKRFTDQGVEDD